MSDSAWWYDTATGEVSQAKRRGWGTRMGPYDTKEEAQQAVERVKARNAAADAQEREDSDVDEGA